MEKFFYLFLSWSISRSLLETVVLCTSFNWSNLQRQWQCGGTDEQTLWEAKYLNLKELASHLSAKPWNSRSAKIRDVPVFVSVPAASAVVVVVAYFVPRAKKLLTTFLSHGTSSIQTRKYHNWSKIPSGEIWALRTEQNNII